MNWDDVGFLLSKNKYNENSLITEIYTKNHGKISGIIFGGTSKKIKNYLQIGNNLYVNFNSKSDNKIGYFKVEILKALSPIYFENPQKLLSILSAMQLVKLLTADYQTNKDIYTLINKFYFLLNNKDWIKKYIFWELELFKLLGYDLELKDLVDKKLIGNEFKYVSKSSIEKKIIPNFLVDQNVTSVDVINLQKGLKFVGDYLEKTILKPNNLNQPSSRLEFISTVK